MDVVDVRVVIAVVVDEVFPKSALPDPALAGAAAARRVGGLRQPARERRLDQPPAGREVVIAFRQRPDAMQMIGQHADGDRLERQASSAVPKRGAQRADVLDEQTAAPVGEIDREEISSAGFVEASVFGHRRRMVVRQT